MTQVSVIDANAQIQVINSLYSPSQQLSSNSRSIVLSTNGTMTPNVTQIQNVNISNNAVINAIGYRDVNIFVSNIHSGDYVTISASLDNSNFSNIHLVITDTSNTFPFISNTSSNGQFYVKGNSYIKVTKIGANSSPIISVISTN